MSNIRGAQVLITGGASGIGKLMAEECLRRGARRVIIWDLNPEPLAETVRSWVSEGHQVIVKAIDITCTQDVCEAATAITERLGPVDILINNAGIITGKLFEDHTHSDIDRTMQVNTQAMMHITRVSARDDCFWSRAFGQYCFSGGYGFKSAHVCLCCEQMGGDRLE